MSGSTKCFSIENERGEVVPEARSRRAGGAARSESMRVGVTSLIIDPFGEFSLYSGREKEERSDS